MGLASSGADPSVLTLGGISALTAAAEESKVPVMEALLKLGLPALGGRRAWADALCASARKGLVDGELSLLPLHNVGNFFRLLTPKPRVKFLRDYVSWLVFALVGSLADGLADWFLGWGFVV